MNNLTPPHLIPNKNTRNLHMAFYKEFLNSPGIRDRWKGSHDIDWVEYQFKGGVGTRWYNNKKSFFNAISKAGGAGIKTFDIGAFLIGGRANWVQYAKEYQKSKEYDAVLKDKGLDAANKKAYEFANKELMKVGSESQQSRYPFHLTHFQRRNAANVFLPFATTPNQYYQQAWIGIRNISRGDASYSDVQRVVNFAILQPMIYAWSTKHLSNALNPFYKTADTKKIGEYFEEEDHMNLALHAVENVALPLVYGNQFLYRFLEYNLRDIQGKDRFDYAPLHLMTYWQRMQWSGSSMNKIRKANDGKKFYEWSAKDQSRFAQDLFVFTDVLTGAGHQNLAKYTNRVIRYFNGEVEGLEEQGKKDAEKVIKSNELKEFELMKPTLE